MSGGVRVQIDLQSESFASWLDSIFSVKDWSNAALLQTRPLFYHLLLDHTITREQEPTDTFTALPARDTDSQPRGSSLFPIANWKN